jgi:hypothetical protein
MSDYDPHELKIVRRGVSVDKVIAAYKHFGSLRKAANVCKISKDTVANVLLRYKVSPLKAVLPRKSFHSSHTHYSAFARWYAAHASDSNLPHSIVEFAALSGSNPNTVRCYLYRRRKEVRKLLMSLPDLRSLDLRLEDIEGFTFSSGDLEHYRYAIDRYSASAVLQGTVDITGEVTVFIPSVEQFVKRVRKLTSTESQGSPKHQST